MLNVDGCQHAERADGVPFEEWANELFSTASLSSSERRRSESESSRALVV